MDKKIIEEYAKLIAVSGGAIKKGDEVIITSSLENEEFAALVAKECYLAGAKRVQVKWVSLTLSRLDYQYADENLLSSLDQEGVGYQEYLNDVLPVLIYLDDDDPDGFNGLDGEKVTRINGTKRRNIAPFRQKRENKYKWCIAGVPSKAWAKKVFPELSESEAVEKLWEAVLSTARALDGKGIENWKKHDEAIKAQAAKLNAMNLVSLEYHSSNGTDFRVGLIPGAIFQAGGELTMGTHEEFQPNIPSEECFTSPMKGVAEGIVYSTKPLSYQGKLIEDFSIRFKDGKAIGVKAKTGEDVLKGIIAIDEGAAYLGEVSLVPFDSPINQTGILFFSTLYDENACCHLALGTGFESLYPGYETMTNEEIRQAGINYSVSHVDFMIGSKDLKIVGTSRNGVKTIIFENGTWAI